MKINLAGIEWKNPITTASGTFGSGFEFSEFFDIGILGAITVKGVSPEPWTGNPPPRIAETHGGMLNAIGLQNQGAEHFIQNDIAFLRQFKDTKIIVNVCGRSMDEYAAVVERLASADVDMLELNISCPNVSAGGIAFGTNKDLTYALVSRCKALSKQPLFVKLSPNVTDIAEIAKAAEAAGADGLTLVNTLMGMAIDIKKRKPLLGNTFGGLSGPAIKPVALRCVYQVYKAVKIPIIGMGGISSAEDAIEFIMAGARAVAIGTAGLINPNVYGEVLDGLRLFMKNEGIGDINEIVGAAHGKGK